jgi:hypothetical protein
VIAAAAEAVAGGGGSGHWWQQDWAQALAEAVAEMDSCCAGSKEWVFNNITRKYF